MTDATHDKAAILSIGDELAIGQKLDTNSRWLSARLTDMGIRVIEHVTVADELARVTDTMRRLAAQAPLLLATGGLGPTLDDLTRPALAALLGEKLITDEDALHTLIDLFAARRRTMTDNQRLQAQRPPSATLLDNPLGTAPGLAANFGPCSIFCLPGPPREMHPMFEARVRPRIRVPSSTTIRTRVLHSIGLAEADLAQRLGDLMLRGRNPSVGTTASGGLISVRIRYEGDAERANRTVEDAEIVVRERLDPYVFGADDQTLEFVVVDLLRERDERLLTVESCTGGGLGSRITEVAGASDVYLGGWVTYANDAKALEVGVSRELLESFGAVSEQAARAMAEGALASDLGAQAQHALSITGIAGPAGGSESKPVGTVFIARADRTGPSDVRHFLITGDRHDIRERSATMALAMLMLHLRGNDRSDLLWQVAGSDQQRTDGS